MIQAPAEIQPAPVASSRHAGCKILMASLQSVPGLPKTASQCPACWATAALAWGAMAEVSSKPAPHAWHRPETGPGVRTSSLRCSPSVVFFARCLGRRPAQQIRSLTADEFLCVPLALSTLQFQQPTEQT